MLMSFLANSIVTATTLSSMRIVAGTKRRTAIGAMYMSRFMELIFSLRVDKRTELASIHGTGLEEANKAVICDRTSRPNITGGGDYPSEDIRIPCKTVFSALAAVAPTHMMNPNRLKLGSPCKNWNIVT